MCNKIIQPAIVALIIFCFGCVKQPNLKSNENTELSPDEYFSFQTTNSVNVSIDYNFTNTDYVVLFELYTQNPLLEDEDGNIEFNKDIEPIYRASTDGKGKFNAKITLPSYLSSVWLNSNYFGTGTPVKLDIEDNNIFYKASNAISVLNTRALNGNNFTYPDDWKILGDWDSYGTPAYLEQERVLPPANVLYNLNKLFVNVPNKPLDERFPELFAEGLQSNIDIIKPTKIYLTFISTSASWRSSLGYYIYPTNNPPQTLEEVERIMAYPSVTNFLKNDVRGALSAGDRVHLKFWDGEKYIDEIPAGYTLGFWLQGLAFNQNNGNVAYRGVNNHRFSDGNLNADKKQRTVALLDEYSKRIVAIAFEDNTDMRFNDAIFYIETTENGAIDDSIIPSLPELDGTPKPEENYTTSTGVLLFEDLWPWEGDYDMNDVMISYRIHLYKNLVNNLIYKIVAQFIPYHSGGTIESGFGFQLHHITPNLVHNVDIKSNVVSKFMQGNMLEANQTLPTVILFDDTKKVLGEEFTITIEVNGVSESLLQPPFNPFIIPNSNISRSNEVHLVKFPPTSLMDVTLLGTGHDASKPNEGLFYVYNVIDANQMQFPFALNIPNVANIGVPKEYQRIDVTYPQFKGWVESNGSKNKDWYLHPVE